MPTPFNATPKTESGALISGAIGGVSVAAPAAAVLMLAKAYRQERRRMDLARAKDSDTLVITLPEKRGQLMPGPDAVGGKFRETATAIGDKVRDATTGASPSPSNGPGWLSRVTTATGDALKGAKHNVVNAAGSAADKVGKVFSADNVKGTIGSLARSGVAAAKDVMNLGAKELSDSAKLPEAYMQALKYLSFVIAGGVTLRGADALYDAYNQRKLRRLEDASRKEYINRLFAKDAQDEKQDGQLAGGVLAIMALLAGTSAYGTKKVLDVMYPKTYTKVKAPVVRRIEFRSLPRDAQKADAAEEYEEFQEGKPMLKAAAIMEDGSERDLPWDVVRVLGLRHALLQDANDNGFRKFANHEAVIDWCAERHITTDQLREKLAQAAQTANAQQQAEFYRMVDDVMKNQGLLGKVDEIAQTAVPAGRSATPWFGRPGLGLVGNSTLAGRTRDAITAKLRHEMASGLADKFGLAMPAFNSPVGDSAISKNITAEVMKREPELRSLAYKAVAGNQNVAAALAQNAQATMAYQNMSPTLKKVMDWLGQREPGSLPRMLYDWIIKRQVAAGLNSAESDYAKTQASIFANAPPAVAAAENARPAGARRKGQPGQPAPALAGASAPAQPAAPTYGMPGGLGGMPAFAGQAEAISPMLRGAVAAGTPVEPGAAAPAPQTIAASPGLTLNQGRSYAGVMAAGAAAARTPASPGAAAPKPAVPAPVADKPAAKSDIPAPQTTSSSGPVGASNVLNGKPFFDFLPKGNGFEHAASAGFSPATLAEKLLTAPKKDKEDEDADEDAVRKLPPAKRRHIDVEATDPRAEAFMRKNKSRLVAALSNAVNSGAL